MKRDNSIANPYPANRRWCAACGTPIGRRSARYCRVCGKFLLEDYQPLDNLRASYGLQGKAIVFEKTLDREAVANLFEINENGASQDTWASFVYSLVPYVGIVFIPLTLLLGGVSLVISSKNPAVGGRQLALASMALSFVVLAVQVLLWWLLYIIPTL